MSFGDREEIVAMANNRLAVVKKEFPEAALLDEDSVRVIYLITHKRDLYHDNAMLEKHSTERIARIRAAWRETEECNNNAG